MNKSIHLATTLNCSSCKLMEYILNDILENRQDIELKVVDYSELPEFIQTNVRLTDFPVTIFLKDGFIKYSFAGTKPKREVERIMEDINF